MSLDAERWAAAATLFERLAEAPAAERDTVLYRLASEAPEVHELVLRMLRADLTGDPVLDRGIENLAHLIEDAGTAIAREESAAQAIGRRMGPYRIIREAGRGGMGIVYLAERDDPQFHQVVALKCLPSSLASADMMSRFLRERRILAALQHPNIAQLHDGGFTDTGEPYFAMEYVEGEPITDYCDARRLTVDDRLHLFLTVCDAVQYAHQHLTVHRDLKPSNVLVTSDGHVKLLDFGIAKLLDDPIARRDPETITTHALTPEYASPEQLRGDAVTAASDVFSLGVLCFELLTGRRPFPSEPGPLGTIRAVLDADPARASVAAAEAVRDARGTVAEDTIGRAAARSSSPSSLRRRLRGDLDTILEKTLHKEPGERYASVQALADDVRSHLAGRPVLARPQSRYYRTAKFTRRHRIGVAATAALAASLLIGISATAWQARRAQRERDAAQAEAAKAQRVTEFLVDIFGAADPATARGRDPTAREILERGAKQIETELASEPVIQATVRRAIGRIYFSLGDYARAGSLIERSLADHERLLPPGHAEIADDLQALATVARFVGGPADSLYEVLLAMRRGSLAPDDPKIAFALHGLAETRRSDTTEMPDTLLRQAIAILERSPGHEGAAADAVYSLGFLHHSRGMYAVAESLYHEALTRKRAFHGDDHPSTLVTMSNLGWLLQLRGDYDGADSLLRRVLATRRRVLGDRHTGVASTLAGLGEVAHRRGNGAEAEQFFAQALAIQREHFAAGSVPIVGSLTMIATTQAAQGKWAQAHATFREAIAQLKAAGQPDGTAMARLLNNRAGIYEQAGQHATALTEFRRAWDMYRAHAGEDHAFSATAQGNVGTQLLVLDSLAEAESVLRDALGKLERAYSKEHVTLGQVLISLGTVELRRGSLTDAEATLRRALTIVEANLPPRHWRVAMAKLRLGRCLAAQGRREQAEAYIADALDVLEDSQSLRPADYREARAALAQIRRVRDAT